MIDGTKTMFVQSGIKGMFAGVIGGAGYYGYHFYKDDQRKQADVQPAAPLTPQEAIDKLENLAPWNGPGNPTFGVGEKPAQP